MKAPEALGLKTHAQRYNIRVPTKPEAESTNKPTRRNVYAAEAVGLSLIAALLLALTLIRYWHVIHWSWR